MYVTMRAALVRNAVVSVFNGGITLAILLIAPLGLAAVIANTLLVAASTLVMTTAGDGVVYFLQGGRASVESLPGRPNNRSIQRRDDVDPPSRYR
ncbi:hypothetical protein GFS31_41030 (plasmid) [Leptolyngbya sp. BL0902]|uniref:CRISPR-associated protein Csx18 n=1 Tax=Leptolyngbya sp. BL0902 TaxID=1115757 RepID=UPI0019364260|nr:hypothetical protein GFS31_41030 [Leptolyngbya sp. BL0902]